MDTSVARASGGDDATYPTSRNCRDFLKGILDVCHRVSFPKPLLAEWKEHRSNFARTWLVQMFARKKVILTDLTEDPQLRESVNLSDFDDQQKEDARKDCHLIEAAWDADRTVVSLDEVAKGLFVRLVAAEARLSDVMWVNPDQEPQSKIAWLADGAPVNINLTLS